jgi:Bacterial Ig-like domain
MQASTVTWQNIALTNAAGASIDRQVTLATDNRTCTVLPVGSLARNTRFTVRVLTGVRDLAGNSMAAVYSFSFTTVA